MLPRRSLPEGWQCHYPRVRREMAAASWAEQRPPGQAWSWTARAVLPHVWAGLLEHSRMSSSPALGSEQRPQEHLTAQGRTWTIAVHQEGTSRGGGVSWKGGEERSRGQVGCPRHEGRQGWFCPQTDASSNRKRLWPPAAWRVWWTQYLRFLLSWPQSAGSPGYHGAKALWSTVGRGEGWKGSKDVEGGGKWVEKLRVSNREGWGGPKRKAGLEGHQCRRTLYKGLSRRGSGPSLLLLLAPRA